MFAAPLLQHVQQLLLLSLILPLLLALTTAGKNEAQAFTSTPFGVRPDAKLPQPSSSILTMTTEGNTSPSTFREAEVLGLKLMQEQKYDEALKGECVH